MNRYSFDEMNHIHQLDGLPLYGTTTVLSVLSKPLTWWASGLAVKELSGIEDPSIFTKIKNKKASQKEIAETKTMVSEWMREHREMFSNVDVDSYLPMLDKAYRAHSVKLETTAQAGIDLHAELERFVKNEMIGVKDTYDPKIAPFVTWTMENVKRFLWSEGYCYSENHWLGGISDVGCELNDGMLVIGDFKSSKAVYSSHILQAGAYDICISENGILDKWGNLTYKPEKPFEGYFVLPFGAPIVEPHYHTEFNVTTQECQEAFINALGLYKTLQKMEQR